MLVTLTVTLYICTVKLLKNIHICAAKLTKYTHLYSQTYKITFAQSNYKYYTINCTVKLTKLIILCSQTYKTYNFVQSNLQISYINTAIFNKIHLYSQIYKAYKFVQSNLQILYICTVKLKNLIHLKSHFK